MNIDRSQILALLIKYLTASGKSAGDLTADTPLLQQGILDSFTLTEFTAVLEDELGLELSETGLVVEDFQSIDSLCDFLEQR